MMVAGVAGAVGLLAAGVGWWVDPRAFHFAWLAAVSVWMSWPLGALILLLLHAKTGGRWGAALRPAMVAGVATLPLLVPVAFPLAMGMATTYPWVHRSVPNGFYLNFPFFALRTAMYAIVWFGLSAFAVLRVRRQRSLAGVAPIGLMLLALTLTFAAIDLTMSLDPAFNSSVYGLIALVGSALLAASVATGISVAAIPADSVAQLGRITLGLVIFWAYLDFVQFLIVWESDLAPESAWYLARSRGVWAWGSATLIVGHFLVPFAALLVPAVRRSRIGIAAVCAWLVAMEVVRAWWLVLPAGHLVPGWIAIACMVAVAGLGFASTRFVQRRGLAHV